MTRDDETSPKGKAGSGSSGPDFDRRLDVLRNRLAEEDRSREATVESGNARADSGSLGQAMRLSSELVAGIVGGAALGWLIDRFLGSAPWGLMVFLLLGFAAGIFSVMRTSGFLKKAPARRSE